MKKLIIVTLLCFTCFAREYNIITNHLNTETVISKSDLGKILLGSKTLWSKKVFIRMIIQNKNEAKFNKVLIELTNKSKSQYMRYWRKKLFSGSGVPPRQETSQRKVEEFVAQQEGAIGIIFGDPDKIVKRLKLVD